MSTFVRFWGTRGSIPTPGHKTRRYGGNTSCVEIRIDDSLFICDAGTGLRELGVHLLAREDKHLEAHLFFSHMHWDHIQGFPFFVPAYSPEAELHVYEAKEANERVVRLLQAQMSSEYFPVSFADLKSRIHFGAVTSDTSVDGVRIRAFEQIHPGKSFAYSFEKNGTKVVYATDNELDLSAKNRDTIATNPDERRILPKEFVRFCENADLLIADGQYTESEYLKKEGWGHARATTVVDLGLQSGAKQVAVFHHDPMHSDQDVEDKISICERRVIFSGSKMVVFGAREGMTLKL